MFSIFDSSGNRLPIAYNGLTLNSPDDGLKDTYRIDAIEPHTQLAAVSEASQTRDGSEIYDARKVIRVVNMAGVIIAPNRAALFDKMRTLARTFDPALLSRDNSTTHGFIALDGSIPTEDTATYPSGVIPIRVYARPQTTPQPVVRQKQPHTARFVLTMVCADPRAYLQTESTDAWGAGTNTVLNSQADYPSWPTITVAATGAGSPLFMLDKAGDSINALVLDLSSLASGDSVVIDMEEHTITRNGIADPSLYVSGGWFDLSPGSNTVSVTNPTNVTVSAAWRPAFCL